MSKYLDYDGLSRFKSKNDAKYQAKLVSGTNIKTINGQSLLGSGNISISPSGMYVHRIRIAVTSTMYLDVKIITSKSTPYGNIEDFESMVAGHMHLLYNPVANTYKPIFIVDFYGEYANFNYIDIVNGSFRSVSNYSNIQYNIISDSVFQA